MKVNIKNYEIKWSSFYEKYQVRNVDTDKIVEEFVEINDAINWCKNN